MQRQSQSGAEDLGHPRCSSSPPRSPGLRARPPRVGIPSWNSQRGPDGAGALSSPDKSSSLHNLSVFPAAPEAGAAVPPRLPDLQLGWDLGREGWEQSVPDPLRDFPSRKGVLGCSPCTPRAEHPFPPSFSTGLGLRSQWKAGGIPVASQGPPCPSGVTFPLEKGMAKPCWIRRERPQNKVTKQKQWPWLCDNNEIIIKIKIIINNFISYF